MDSKLGCLQSSHLEFVRAGVAKVGEYNCSLFSYQLPDDKDEHYQVKCPLCNLNIEITVDGRITAQIKRKKSYIWGCLIVLVFILGIITAPNGWGYDPLVIIVFLLLAAYSSYEFFFIGKKNAFYGLAHTKSFNHKIFYK